MFLQVEQKPRVIACRWFNGNGEVTEKTKKPVDVVGVHLHGRIKEWSAPDQVCHVVNKADSVAKPVDHPHCQCFSIGAGEVQNRDSSWVKACEKGFGDSQSSVFRDVLEDKKGMDEIKDASDGLREMDLWSIAPSFLQHGVGHVNANDLTYPGDRDCSSARTAPEIECGLGRKVRIEESCDVSEHMGNVLLTAFKELLSAGSGQPASVLTVAQNGEVWVSSAPLLPVFVGIQGWQE